MFEELGFEVDVAGIVAGTVDEPDDVVRWQEPPAGVTINVPPGNALLYTCSPTAQCVLPPPAYVDGYEPTTDWLPVHAAAEGFGEVMTQSFTDAAAAEAALTAAVATASHEEQVASTRIDQGDREHRDLGSGAQGPRSGDVGVGLPLHRCGDSRWLADPNGRVPRPLRAKRPMRR